MTKEQVRQYSSSQTLRDVSWRVYDSSLFLFCWLTIVGESASSKKKKKSRHLLWGSRWVLVLKFSPVSRCKCNSRWYTPSRRFCHNVVRLPDNGIRYWQKSFAGGFSSDHCQYTKDIFFSQQTLTRLRSLSSRRIGVCDEKLRTTILPLLPMRTIVLTYLAPLPMCAKHFSPRTLMCLHWQCCSLFVYLVYQGMNGSSSLHIYLLISLLSIIQMFPVEELFWYLSILLHPSYYWKLYVW